MKGLRRVAAVSDRDEAQHLMVRRHQFATLLGDVARGGLSVSAESQACRMFRWDMTATASSANAPWLDHVSSTL